MKFCHMPFKNKTGAKSSIRTGLGSIVVLLAAGILFTMLFFISSAAGQANPYTGTTFDSPYNQLFSGGVTLDSWQYIDATSRGATTTAGTDGIPAGGASWFGGSQTGPAAYDTRNLLQYNPAATPDTMAYPPGGKGYTSAPAIYITDITGRGANAAACPVAVSPESQ